MALKDLNQITASSPFFLLGEVFNNNTGQNERYELGLAIDNDSGRLTNEKLLAMSDKELEAIALSKNGVYAETYRFPADPAWCKRRGDGTLPNERHEGPHRAVTILAYREAVKRYGLSEK